MEEIRQILDSFYSPIKDHPIEITISIPLFAIIVYFYKKVPSLINYICRPRRLHIEFKNENITFTKISESDRWIEIPCIKIKNDTSKTLNIISNSVMLGNNRIPTGGGEIMCKLYAEGYVVKKNRNYHFMYEHYNIDNEHKDIVTGQTTFSMSPGDTTLFPYAYLGSGPTGSFCMKSFPKKSLLIPSKNKVSISLKINGKDHEYGLNKLSIYEVHMNFINGCEARDHLESYVSMMIFHQQQINKFLASINKKNL